MKKNISNCLAISKKNVTFAVELRFLQVETRKSEHSLLLYNKEVQERTRESEHR